MEVFFSNTKVIERLARIEKRLETLEAQGKKIAPEASMRLRAFTLTPMHEVKVLILGQDPYHGKNQADGLCFSVKKNIPLPPSLKNIFKEMCEDLGCNMPQNGDLTSWAKQGVILLNTILTVEEGCPLSHKDLGWQEIVYTYLEELLKQKKPLAICLWGQQALKFFAPLKEQMSLEHLLLLSSHPSPLAAHRGFFGSRPFSKINAFLKEKETQEIVWHQTERD
ncbi:MAG: uracil-DNA glycosylase [Chlamydiia bacterium]|jgi:uracil-DNA glycosylase